jgi:hypothetical protein
VIANQPHNPHQHPRKQGYEKQLGQLVVEKILQIQNVLFPQSLEKFPPSHNK